MAGVLLLPARSHKPFSPASFPENRSFNFPKSLAFQKPLSFRTSIKTLRSPQFIPVYNQLEKNSARNAPQGDEVNNLGVKAALSTLRFYKSEISPLLPNSCRYVPTCSEYSMEAYKKYGVVKGTILTGWRLCRCNPLGGSGFDPPRWFGETRPPE
ncbi:UPF0161 protein At3g09310 [Malania oleifera]|uniref:UPF0161 protein At3g09310 n=1 Tax=Malania oleifera TaxID=397392 RepID=UPI0025ADD41D|nr:UPF0161 protein At3g09310 [Malania oleifera]